ncbi:uncharacterized protein [Haliotis cracherodii]|uniref:uncharacterized protein n=1 Tax=Haliotis cracherodii TaxID=6455 RepID=UPI0039EB0E10
MVNKIYWIIKVWSVWHICLFQWSSCVKCPIPCNCKTGTFERVANCSGLKVSSEAIDTMFTDLQPQTTNLYIYNMDIDGFPEHQQLTSPALRTLHIKSGRLHSLRRGLRFLSATVKANLAVVNLSGNKLTVLLPDDFLNFTNLDTLDLSNNRLDKIYSNAFADLPTLQELDLSNNPISNQLRNHKIFNGLHNLVTLKLRNCSLSSVHERAFSQLRNLEYLDLEQNAFQALPVMALNKIPKLRGLYARYNDVRELHDTTASLRSLAYLYLSHNNISIIHPSALSGLEKLREIYIEGNMLKTLPHQLQMTFHYLDKVNLLDNPWQCDCGLVWLRNWYDNKSSSYSSPVCEWPAHIAIRDIHPQDMRCPLNNVSLHVACHVTSWSGGDECPLCPAFRKVDKDNSCTCLPGYTRNVTDVCSPCPLGFYKASSGPGPCVPCDERSSTITSGSDTCVCAPGWTMRRGRCRECPENTYKSQFGLHACVPCQEHAFSPEGSTGQEMCQCLDDAGRPIKDVTTCEAPLRPYRVTVHVPAKEEPAEHDNPNSILPKVYVPMGVASFLSATCIVIVIAVCCRRRRSRYSQLFFSSRKKGVKIIHASPDECRFTDGKYFSFEGRYAEWSHITVKRLKIGRLLGRGAFGNVHEGFAYGTGIADNRPLRVAIKRLKDSASDEERQAFKTELDQMRLLGNHTNIIGLVGSCNLNGQMAILMEYAEMGNLLSYLKEKSAKLENYVSVSADGAIAEEKSRQITEETELMLFAWQIARGMAHLESLKCVHRDLASRNVLIAAGPIAKISDFGLTRDVYENGYYFRTSKGRLPYKWLSPEALLWGQYNNKSDVWSFGVLLWEIATLGGSPYPGVPADHLSELHRTGYRMPQPPNCPDKLYGIINACWNEDPRQRPPFHRLTEILDQLLLGVAEREYLALESVPKQEMFHSSQAKSADTIVRQENTKGAVGMTSVDNSDMSTSGYSSSQAGFYS